MRIFTGGVVCREQRRAHTNPPLQLHHIANGHCDTIVLEKGHTRGEHKKKTHIPDTHAAAAGLRFFHLTRTSPYGSHTTPTTGGTIHTPPGFSFRIKASYSLSSNAVFHRYHTPFFFCLRPISTYIQFTSPTQHTANTVARRFGDLFSTNTHEHTHIHRETETEIVHRNFHTIFTYFLAYFPRDAFDVSQVAESGTLV